MENIVIEFREYNPDETTVELTFNEDADGITCARFHDLCKRFAYAVGYMPSNIEEIFGRTRYEFK